VNSNEEVEVKKQSCRKKKESFLSQLYSHTTMRWGGDGMREAEGHTPLDVAPDKLRRLFPIRLASEEEAGPDLSAKGQVPAPRIAPIATLPFTSLHSCQDRLPYTLQPPAGASGAN
jgi:hypothetical protein